MRVLVEQVERKASEAVEPDKMESAKARCFAVRFKVTQNHQGLTKKARLELCPLFHVEQSVTNPESSIGVLDRVSAR